MARKSDAHKSAKTGRFVSEEYAEKHPDTTYKTEVKKGPVKKRK